MQDIEGMVSGLGSGSTLTGTNLYKGLLPERE
jgi:hypothetical protein